MNISDKLNQFFYAALAVGNVTHEDRVVAFFSCQTLEVNDTSELVEIYWSLDKTSDVYIKVIRLDPKLTQIRHNSGYASISIGEKKTWSGDRVQETLTFCTKKIKP